MFPGWRLGCIITHLHPESTFISTQILHLGPRDADPSPAKILNTSPERTSWCVSAHFHCGCLFNLIQQIHREGLWYQSGAYPDITDSRLYELI